MRHFRWQTLMFYFFESEKLNTSVRDIKEIYETIIPIHFIVACLHSFCF
jgi:hypothetical protein